MKLYYVFINNVKKLFILVVFNLFLFSLIFSSDKYENIVTDKNREIKILAEQNKILKYRLYGVSSEKQAKINIDQLPLFVIFHASIIKQQ